MTSIKSGFAFHLPHDRLVDFCFDYDERVKSIKVDEPQDEQALRLRLLQMIPESRLPRPLIEAWETYNEARKTYHEAWKTFAKAEKACLEVWEAYEEAGKVFDEAEEAYEEAWKICEPELIKLHEELCPNCPFNGSTIFTRKDKNNQWY